MSRFLAAFLLVLSATASSTAGVTYNIVEYSQYQQGYVLSGEITTDGTIGDLTGHIVAWHWYTSNGTTTWEFDSSMDHTTVDMNGVSATADGKIVVHRFPIRELTTQRNFLLLSSTIGTQSTIGLYWRTGGFGGSLQSASDGFSILGSRAVPLPAWGSIGILSMPDTTGDIVVATLAPVSSVPEPATLGSLVLGLAGLGLRRAIRNRRAD